VLEEKLRENFIKTVNLRYDWGEGFRSDPLVIREGVSSISMSVVSNDRKTRDFSPKAYEVGPAKVELLGLLVTQWGTALALRVRHNDPDLRLSLDWVKPRARARSAIALTDDANEERYLPVWSDLDGYLEPDFHRIGLVLFERFRKSTWKLSVRLDLAIQGSTVELVFKMEDIDLGTDIGLEILKPTLAEQTRLYFEDLATSAREKAEAVFQDASGNIRAVQSGRSGCLILVFAILAVGLCWIGGARAISLLSMLVPHDASQMTAYPIAAREGSPKYDDAETIKPLTALPD
jgi:hypothetical protein